MSVEQRLYRLPTVKCATGVEMNSKRWHHTKVLAALTWWNLRNLLYWLTTPRLVYMISNQRPTVPTSWRMQQASRVVGRTEPSPSTNSKVGKGVEMNSKRWHHTKVLAALTWWNLRNLLYWLTTPRQVYMISKTRPTVPTSWSVQQESHDVSRRETLPSTNSKVCNRCWNEFQEMTSY